MSKHTPGPWGIFDIDHCAVGECENTDILGRAVAVTTHHAVNPFYGIEYEEAKVNARLIAAAPDLLKACKALLKSFDCAAEHSIGKSRKLANAAIAKAEEGP